MLQPHNFNPVSGFPSSPLALLPSSFRARRTESLKSSDCQQLMTDPLSRKHNPKINKRRATQGKPLSEIVTPTKTLALKPSEHSSLNPTSVPSDDEDDSDPEFYEADEFFYDEYQDARNSVSETEVDKQAHPVSEIDPEKDQREPERQTRIEVGGVPESPFDKAEEEPVADSSGGWWNAIARCVKAIPQIPGAVMKLMPPYEVADDSDLDDYLPDVEVMPDISEVTKDDPTVVEGLNNFLKGCVSNGVSIAKKVPELCKKAAAQIEQLPGGQYLKGAAAKAVGVIGVLDNKAKLSDYVVRQVAAYLAGTDPGKLLHTDNKTQVLTAVGTLVSALTTSYDEYIKAGGDESVSEITLDCIEVQGTVLTNVKASIAPLEKGGFDIQHLSFDLAPRARDQATYQNAHVAVEHIKISQETTTPGSNGLGAGIAIVSESTQEAGKKLFEALTPDRVHIDIGSLKFSATGKWLTQRAESQDQVGFSLSNATIDGYFDKEQYPSIHPRLVIKPREIKASLQSDSVLQQANASLAIDADRNGKVMIDTQLDLSKISRVFSLFGRKGVVDVSLNLDVCNGTVSLDDLPKNIKLPFGSRFVTLLVKTLIRRTFRAKQSKLSLRDGGAVLTIQPSIVSNNVENNWFARTFPNLVDWMNNKMAGSAIEIPLPVKGFKESANSKLGEFVIDDALCVGSVPVSLYDQKHMDLLRDIKKNEPSALKAKRWLGARNESSHMLVLAQQYRDRVYDEIDSGRVSSARARLQAFPDSALDCLLHDEFSCIETRQSLESLWRFLGSLTEVAPEKMVKALHRTGMHENNAMVEAIEKRVQDKEALAALMHEEDIDEYEHQTKNLTDLLYFLSCAKLSGRREDIHALSGSAPSKTQAMCEHVASSVWRTLRTLGIGLLGGHLIPNPWLLAAGGFFNQAEGLLEAPEETVSDRIRSAIDVAIIEEQDALRQVKGVTEESVRKTYLDKLFEECRHRYQKTGDYRFMVILREVCNAGLCSVQSLQENLQLGVGTPENHVLQDAAMRVALYHQRSLPDEYDNYALLEEIRKLEEKDRKHPAEPVSQPANSEEYARRFLLEGTQEQIKALYDYYFVHPHSKDEEQMLSYLPKVKAGLKKLTGVVAGDDRKKIIRDFPEGSATQLMCMYKQGTMVRGVRTLLKGLPENKKDKEYGQRLSLIPVERLSRELAVVKASLANYQVRHTEESTESQLMRSQMVLLESLLRDIYKHMLDFNPDAIFPSVLSVDDKRDLREKLQAKLDSEHTTMTQHKITSLQKVIEALSLEKALTEEAGILPKDLSPDEFIKALSGIASGYTSVLSTIAPWQLTWLLKVIMSNYACDFGREGDRANWGDYIAKLSSSAIHALWAGKKEELPIMEEYFSKVQVPEVK